MHEALERMAEVGREVYDSRRQDGRDQMSVIDQVVTKQFALYHGDSCEVLKSLPDQSVHLSLYSPPFAGLNSQNGGV